MSEAKDFLRSAEAIGCRPELSGSKDFWIKWSPPLPPEMIMDAVRLADEIVAELAASKRAARTQSA